MLAWLSVWRRCRLAHDMAQLMPLPLTVACFSKIPIGFTFLVPAHPGRPNPGKGTLNGCVCVFLRHARKFASFASLVNLQRQLCDMPSHAHHSSVGHCSSHVLHFLLNNTQDSTNRKKCESTQLSWVNSALHPSGDAKSSTASAGAKERKALYVMQSRN